MASSPVFPNDPLDTPVLTPGWTVQNSGTGTDQNLTKHTANVPMAFIAQDTDTIGSSYTQAQIQNLQTKLNTLLTELINAGLMKSS